jgi:arylsulfatase A-like enzyme
MSVARFKFAFVVQLLVLTCQTAVSAPAGPPNILFIMADDMGYADAGCYGQKVIPTPNLDQLAGEGTRFTQVYAGSPVCAPSRSVLMTGFHAGRTTVRGNMGIGGVRGLDGSQGRVPLKAEDRTVAESLKELGYATGMTGKWGLGEPGTSGEPNRQGFDEWFGFLNQGRAHDHFPEYLWHNTERKELEGNRGGEGPHYAHDLFTGFAMDFIRRHADGERPFFLYLPYTLPHDKYQTPSTAPFTDKPWTRDEKVHAAMIARIDRDTGSLMRLLQKLGLAENTVVFFTSDNGAARRWEGRFDSSGPLRGRKRDLYEGGIRVPMIVRWPGVVPAGTINEAPWYFPDVLPTLVAIAGGKPPEGIDGISVLPVLKGDAQPELSGRHLYWEFFEGGFKQAARRGAWKVVRPAAEAPLELYHLDRDPSEARDIAGEHPEVIEQFEAYLKTARTPSEHWPVQR